MTKFVEYFRQHTCLYDIKADILDEESQLSWLKLSRQMRYSIVRCQKYWKQRLEEYAKYLESNDKVPSPMMAEMEFVRDNVPQLLERAKQLCGDNVELPVSSACSSECADNDETAMFTMKREVIEETLATLQEMPAPPPQKRARRNAVDDESFISETEQETQTPYQRAATPKLQQPVIALTRLPHSSTPMTTPVSEERPPPNIPSISVTLPHEGWGKQMLWQLPSEQRTPGVHPDNLPPNLHAFGMFVATTLDNLPARKQIIARGKIFEVLQNAELEN